MMPVTSILLVVTLALSLNFNFPRDVRLSPVIMDILSMNKEYRGLFLGYQGFIEAYTDSRSVYRECGPTQLPR